MAAYRFRHPVSWVLLGKVFTAPEYELADGDPCEDAYCTALDLAPNGRAMQNPPLYPFIIIIIILLYSSDPEGGRVIKLNSNIALPRCYSYRLTSPSSTRQKLQRRPTDPHSVQATQILRQSRNVQVVPKSNSATAHPPGSQNRLKRLLRLVSYRRYIQATRKVPPYNSRLLFVS